MFNKTSQLRPPIVRMRPYQEVVLQGTASVCYISALKQRGYLNYVYFQSPDRCIMLVIKNDQVLITFRNTANPLNYYLIFVPYEQDKWLVLLKDVDYISHITLAILPKSSKTPIPQSGFRHITLYYGLSHQYPDIVSVVFCEGDNCYFLVSNTNKITSEMYFYSSDIVDKESFSFISVLAIAKHMGKWHGSIIDYKLKVELPIPAYRVEDKDRMITATLYVLSSKDEKQHIGFLYKHTSDTNRFLVSFFTPNDDLINMGQYEPLQYRSLGFWNTNQNLLCLLLMQSKSQESSSVILIIDLEKDKVIRRFNKLLHNLDGASSRLSDTNIREFYQINEYYSRASLMITGQDDIVFTPHYIIDNLTGNFVSIESQSDEKGMFYYADKIWWEWGNEIYNIERVNDNIQLTKESMGTCFLINVLIYKAKPFDFDLAYKTKALLGINSNHTWTLYARIEEQLVEIALPSNDFVISVLKDRASASRITVFLCASHTETGIRFDNSILLIRGQQDIYLKLVYSAGNTYSTIMYEVPVFFAYSEEQYGGILKSYIGYMNAMNTPNVLCIAIARYNPHGQRPYMIISVFDLEKQSIIIRQIVYPDNYDLDISYRRKTIISIDKDTYICIIDFKRVKFVIDFYKRQIHRFMTLTIPIETLVDSLNWSYPIVPIYGYTDTIHIDAPYGFKQEIPFMYQLIMFIQEDYGVPRAHYFGHVRTSSYIFKSLDQIVSSIRTPEHHAIKIPPRFQSPPPYIAKVPEDRKGIYIIPYRTTKPQLKSQVSVEQLVSLLREKRVS